MRRLWCEPDITLIGRDNLLLKQIKPRVDNPALRFILSGQRGVGKTALLEAAFDLAGGKKTLISAGKPHKEICKQIVNDWSLEVDGESKSPTVTEMEKAIFRSHGYTLFVDDLQDTKAVRKINFLKTLADRHKVCGSILAGAGKENIKPLLARLGRVIDVPKLSRKNAMAMAENVCRHLGSRLSHIDVANSANGLPDRIVTMAKGNEILRGEIRSRDEEIDISPVYLLMLACVVLFRYIGRSMDAMDLYMIGAFGMVIIIFGRFVFMRGMR